MRGVIPIHLISWNQGQSFAQRHEALLVLIAAVLQLLTLVAAIVALKYARDTIKPLEKAARAQEESLASARRFNAEVRTDRLLLRLERVLSGVMAIAAARNFDPTEQPQRFALARALLSDTLGVFTQEDLPSCWALSRAATLDEADDHLLAAQDEIVGKIKQSRSELAKFEESA